MERPKLHVEIEDLDQGIAWYTAMFGLAPTARGRDCATWQLGGASARFTIRLRAARPGTGGGRAERGAEPGSSR